MTPAEEMRRAADGITLGGQGIARAVLAEEAGEDRP